MIYNIWIPFFKSGIYKLWISSLTCKSLKFVHQVHHIVGFVSSSLGSSDSLSLRYVILGAAYWLGFMILSIFFFMSKIKMNIQPWSNSYGVQQRDSSWNSDSDNRSYFGSKDDNFDQVNSTTLMKLKRYMSPMKSTVDMMIMWKSLRNPWTYKPTTWWTSKKKEPPPTRPHTKTDKSKLKVSVNWNWTRPTYKIYFVMSNIFIVYISKSHLYKRFVSYSRMGRICCSHKKMFDD